MDHYETLEVSRNASPQVIRAAYKSLMQRLHPDKQPGGEASTGRAAQIAAAYAVLSDPDRRAQYDQSLRRDAEPVVPAATDVPRPLVQRSGRGTGGTRTWAALTAPLTSRLGLGALVAVLGIAALWAFGPWRASPADPRADLASIRRAFASGEATEGERRALFAHKLELLAQHPDVLPAENADKAEEMAARTFALLASPLTVRLDMPLPGGAGVELRIERLSLLVGSFDAQRHLSHLAGHRERLVRALADRLVGEDPARLLSAQGESYLKQLLLDVIVTTLGTDPAQTYPSTYFESPGRYGVVDLVLPESFRLVQFSALPG